MKKFLFALFFVVLAACGNTAADININDPDAFIEDLSDHFAIEEEPSVRVDDAKNQTIHEVGDFTVVVNADNQLSEMYATNDKETIEETLHFIGLPLPEAYENLEPGEMIDTSNDSVYASISRDHEGRTKQMKEIAENSGMAFDENKDHNIYIQFSESEEQIDQ